MIRISVWAEDEPFARFLRSAIELVLGKRGVEGTLSGGITRGCNPLRLGAELDRLPLDVDLIVIGADSVHAGRRVTYKRKRRLLSERVIDANPAVADRCSIAIAEPSVEAWILSAGPAVVRALEAELGPLASRAPARGYTDERSAKRALGEWVRALAGAPLPLNGFEHTDAILRELDFERAPPDLRDWHRDLDRRVAGFS